MRVIFIDGKELMEYDLSCPDCGSNMILRKSKYGYFYGCQDYPETGCKGSVGSKPDGTPIAVPVSMNEKEARINATENFERLWKSGKMDRANSLAWLCNKMNCSRSEAYIARFNIQQCEALIYFINKELNGWEYNY
jgi:ssDNA-binding Zn-finger/Zn-ribbon topoisomerase 1